MTPPEPASAPDPEFQALVRSKYSGNPQAMTALGARLLVGRDAPWSPADGAALITEAAKQGDLGAWGRLAVIAAIGVGRAQSWADAFAALARAVELGDPHAARQASLLRDLGLRGVDDVEDWLAFSARSVSMQVLREAPRFVTHSGFLTPALYAYLVECAAPKLIRAQVHDARQGGLKVDAMRTNTGAAFSVVDTDLVMQMIRARIARAAGVAVAALERAEVLHYTIGECYRPHIDFFHPSLPGYDEEMRLRGQRVKTCLVYLNNDYEGGETDFPQLGMKFRGDTGDALIFENVLADGAGDMKTVHAGQPPTRGEKWLLSQWVRNKPQRVT